VRITTRMIPQDHFGGTPESLPGLSVTFCHDSCELRNDAFEFPVG